MSGEQQATPDSDCTGLMPWPDIPAWLDGSKDATDAAQADRRRSARRPLGPGERLVLLAAAVAGAVFLFNVALRLLAG